MYILRNECSNICYSNVFTLNMYIIIAQKLVVSAKTSYNKYRLESPSYLNVAFYMGWVYKVHVLINMANEMAL